MFHLKIRLTSTHNPVLFWIVFLYLPGFCLLTASKKAFEEIGKTSFTFKHSACIGRKIVRPSATPGIELVRPIITICTAGSLILLPISSSVSYFFLFSLSLRTSLASVSSLNFSSADLFPGFLSG